MRRIAFVVPGDIDTKTGGYIYDKRIATGLRALGWCLDVVPPNLDTLPDGAVALIDGLALVTRGDPIGRHIGRLRLVPLIHLPLALEVGLDAVEADRRDALERRALTAAPLVVVTGRVTFEELARRGVERQRMAIVEPGTDPAPLARGSQTDSVAIVTVAALTPGKGHERLLRALAAVPRSYRWTLTCAGSVDRAPQTADRLRPLVGALGLADRVTFAGELDADRLGALLDRSDLFALATLRETFGMAVAEAIARGLPVVSTTVGAIPEIAGDGGLLVAPDDEAALAAALTRAITDAGVRGRLATGARAARGRLRTWDDASRLMAAALTRIDHDDRIAR